MSSEVAPKLFPGHDPTGAAVCCYPSSGSGSVETSRLINRTHLLSSPPRRRPSARGPLSLLFLACRCCMRKHNHGFKQSGSSIRQFNPSSYSGQAWRVPSSEGNERGGCSGGLCGLFCQKSSITGEPTSCLLLLGGDPAREAFPLCFSRAVTADSPEPDFV